MGNNARILKGAESNLDGDGLNLLKELIFRTDPTNPDTDGDGTSNEETIRERIMNHYFVIILVSILLIGSAAVPHKYESYQAVKTREIFSNMITRDKSDGVYSGQIRSSAGLAEFENNYGVELGAQKINFEKQMLIFGITDNISTRAFQFLKQERSRRFTLDYVDTGIMYKLAIPGEGKKHSYLQVFVLNKIDKISHIRVKNYLRGLSKIY